MSALDRFLLAFRRDTLRCAPHPLDHYVSLYWDDRAAFFQAEEAAWATGQPEPFISMGKVREANGALNAKSARRLARRLNGGLYFAEAAELLHDERYGLDQGWEAALDAARAELGLGRIDAAAAAVAHQRALDLDPQRSATADELLTAIAGLRSAQETVASTGSWGAYLALFDRWIEAGAPETAFRVLMAAITAGVSLTKDDRFSFHGALDTALSLHRPRSVSNLFRALERLPKYSRERIGLKQTEGWIRDVSAGIGEARALDVQVTDPFLASSAALAVGASGHRRPAIEALGALTLAYPKFGYLRQPLARLVGQDVLASHPLSYGPAGPRKVFDVFVFNNELRLLELKLHEMADWIEAFVLVEARQTFTGVAKPLVFEQNRNRFAPFASKIIHVVVDEFPPHVRHPWAREFYQRDMGIAGLNGRCQPDDLVIISDTDEVASREAVLGFEGRFAPLGMERLRYFMNYRQALAPTALRPYAGLWRARYLRSLGLSYARVSAPLDKKVPVIPNGGWHFTSVADASGIVQKMSNTSHQEYRGATTEAVTAMLAQIRSGVLEAGWERVELDERFPAYLRSHRDAFEDVLL